MPHDGNDPKPDTSLPLADRMLQRYAAQETCMKAHALPSRPAVTRLLAEIRELLFPGYITGHRPAGVAMRAQVEARLAAVRVSLTEQVFVGLHRQCQSTPGANCVACEDGARTMASAFLEQLPDVHAHLMTDVCAAWEGDPAARDADEIISSYPGLQAITVYRVAHALHRLGAVIIPRMMTEIAHSETGIDIHPGAEIGPYFFIDHGTGVVIGATSHIGAHVRIYQGVTLGALSLPTHKVRELATAKRHPTLEDNVIIYANATILGGETVIGRGAVIGANAWVTESVSGKVPAGVRPPVNQAHGSNQ